MLHQSLTFKLQQDNHSFLMSLLSSIWFAMLLLSIWFAMYPQKTCATGKFNQQDKCSLTKYNERASFKQIKWLQLLIRKTLQQYDI